MYKNVYVIGVFDLFHKGHVELLKKAKSMGHRLIVAINGDDMVAEYKRRPFYTEQDRLEIIRNCKYVDEAFIIREYDNSLFIEKYAIDAIVHGDDWERASYLKQIRISEDYLKAHGVDVIMVPYTGGISTSGIIKQIKESKECQNKSVQLPTLFQVNENILDKLSFFLKKVGVLFKNVIVVSGSTTSLKYAEVVRTSLGSDGLIIHRNDVQTVEELKEYCQTMKIDLLIGVGGGSVLDVVKRVSLLAKTECLLIPTIISNDGLISPISVIKNNDGQTLSLPGRTPFGIVVDLDIIRNAPPRFLQAAAGDILSNISATNDWTLASAHNGEAVNDLAYMLSRGTAFSLIHHKSKDIKNRNFLKQVVYCQINSGLAMSLSGNSRPCSGSEHLISHAIDYHHLSEHTLHGYQVGSISIFCLYLQKRLDAKCIDYALDFGIPLAFHKLDEKILDNLDLIFQTSFEMRPGRFTILDTYKRDSLRELYNEFLFFLEKFKIHELSLQYQ